jgi:effector-binding domain-containing protein
VHASVVIHAGFPVPASTPSIGRCAVEVLDGGIAAATIHIGPYTAIEPAYQALTTWMHANGRRPAGAPREIYLTNPDVDADESRWRTEVVWPIIADEAQR